MSSPVQAASFLASPPPGLFVGTGRVVECDERGRPTLRLMEAPGRIVSAEWALPYRYLPEIGDLLLVLGKDGRHWITGVVLGAGRSHLAFRGNFGLSSAETLQLRGDQGVRVLGKRVTTRADEVEVHASSIVQKLGESQSTVRGVLRERAGQSSHTIEGEDRRLAGRHETVARRAVKIDGETLILS